MTVSKTRTNTGAVVVDVDGTPSGRDAVAWAIGEAARRGVPVRVLPGREPERLLAEAAGAAVIVMGSASLLAMSDLAGGSAAMEVAVRADVPVVVVRPGIPDAPPGPSAGRVVVGTDGTVLSEAAVRFAFAEADVRGCGVTVVHAIEDAGVPGGESGGAPGTGRGGGSGGDSGHGRGGGSGGRPEAAARAMLRALAAGHPDVRTVVATGRASHALIAESAGAELVVVGSRGRSGLGGMLLGSVSQAVVHRAHCPVAVVRAAPAARGPGGATAGEPARPAPPAGDDMKTDTG